LGAILLLEIEIMGQGSGEWKNSVNIENNQGREQVVGHNFIKLLATYLYKV
jgi:hypothetical protein